MLEDAAAVPTGLAVGEVDEQALIVLAGDGHLSEERGQPPELILAPGLERMVVALGAFQAHAAEDPHLLRHDLLWRRQIAEAVDVSDRAAIALRRDPFAGH